MAKRMILTRFYPRQQILFALVWLLVGTTFVGGFQPSFAQESDELDWTYPVNVPQYHKDGRAPVLVADRAGQIHGFTVDTRDGSDSALVYRKWTKNVGWEVPVDVVLPPRSGTVTILGAEIDDFDFVHLVFFNGDIFGAGLYHVSAPLIGAESGMAWSEVNLIADAPGPLAEGMLIGDGESRLNVVFQGVSTGLGLYETFTLDGGQTWSKPEIIYLSSDEVSLPSAVDIHLDEKGVLHAVWSIWNSQRGVGDELFYSHRASNANDWRQPTLIANRTGSEYESDWGAVTSTGDELLIVYQDSFPASKFMRRSTDGGLTWSTPEKPWPHIGEYENAIFVKDGQNRLHTIMGNRYGDCCHGMWHAKYVDGNWEELKPIIQGPKTIDFDPSAPDAVISQGNLIMATWWMDSKDRNGAWFSYATIDDIAPVAEVPLRAPEMETENLGEDESLLDGVSDLPAPAELPDEWKVEDRNPTTSQAMAFGIGIGFFSILAALAVWYFTFRLR